MACYQSYLVNTRKYVGSRTLEHKGSSDKNGANSDKFNNAIRELEYQDNAGKN